MKIKANVLEIRAPNKFTPTEAVQAEVPALPGGRRGRRLLIAGVGEAVRGSADNCDFCQLSERRPRGQLRIYQYLDNF